MEKAIFKSGEAPVGPRKVEIPDKMLNSTPDAESPTKTPAFPALVQEIQTKQDQDA